MTRLSLAALISATALAPFGAKAAPPGATSLAADALAWVEMAPGVHFAPAYGDWNKEAHGKFIRFAPGAAVPFHTHTGGYHGVTITGRVTNPYPGETDPKAFGPGDSWFVPGGAMHSNACVSAEPCLFYTHSDGPFDLTVPSLTDTAPRP